mmetsp:Transcript_22688/g.65357  ORF Transcript_22688/g.65357 Transcript_22688/m.65357 type:complete len:242 (-) Transcript_22688:1237-1962(-)
MSLELSRVQEAKDPGHGQLCHRQEEGSEQWEGHHQIKVHQQVTAQLSKALNNRCSNNADAGVLSKCPRDILGVRHSAQLFAQPISILRGLASALAKVGHHGVRCISTDGNGTLGPGAQQPLGVDGGKEGSTIVQVTSLDVILRRGVDQLEGKVIPNVAIGISITGAGKFLPETSKFGRGILWCGFGIDTASRFANEGKPLLSLPASVGGDKVLLLTEEDLIRHILNVAGPMRGQGGIASES